MSYFLNNKIYDVYSIDSTVYVNDGDIIKNEYIEIFNNEELILDFTKMNMICSNEQIKGSELHKIKINWGDGTEDILVKDLADKGSSLNTIFQSWRRVSHLYNTDKRNVYLTEDITSLPEIVIHFYNTYNDVIKLVIPFKLVYKSLYDLNCRFDIVSANTGNDYLTTFVFKEGVGDSLSVVQSINPMIQINYDDNIEYIKDKTISVDYSEEFIDEDNVMWAWDQIPYVSIVTTHDKYYPVQTSGLNNSLNGLKCDCFEKTVPVETWEPFVDKILDSGNTPVPNIITDPNGAFTFYVFGGEENTYADLEEGMYQIYLNVTGINDVSGFTDKKIVANPKDQNFAENIVYDNYTEDTTNNLYTFNLRKSNNSQWSYLKSSTLFLRPTLIDETPTGLDINENNWVEADEAFKFEFPLNLDKEDKDGVIQIFKKALPNGQYDAWCESEDLLGNKTDTNNLVKKTVTWKYNNIGNISHTVHNTGEVLYTTIRETKGIGNYTRIGKIIGNFNDTASYQTIKEVVEPDTQIISWIVSNPSEMDKIQFKLEYCENPDEEGSTWEVVSNEKKSHDLWETEKLLQNKRLNETYYDFISDDGANVTKYHYSFTFPHANYPDGFYRATMSHILDMSDFMGERKVETTTSQIQLSYDVPKITITNIEPVFKFNKSTKSWQPYVVFKMDCTKTDITDVTMKFDYPSGLKTSESIVFKPEIEKPLEDCFNGYTSFDVSCVCRDSKDITHKRFETNPKIETFERNTSEFLKCHTSIPDFNDNIDLFGLYKDSTGKNYNGIDVQTETAVDVFRTHRCVIDDVDYFKYVENGVEANYFNDDISYFMSKTFTPVTIEENEEVLDTENVVKRIVQADKFKIDDSKWQTLQSTAQKFNNTIPLTYVYDETLDKAIITLRNENLEESKDIFYSNVKMIKNGNLIHEQSVKNLKQGEIIRDIDLGNYVVELEYSSVHTNTVDSNKLSGNFKILADKDKVLSEIKAKSNSAGEGLYTVTFTWKRNHNSASNLTLFVESGNQIISFENALMYDNYTPPYFFEKGQSMKYYFKMTSSLIDFGTGLTTGEVFRGTHTV